MFITTFSAEQNKWLLSHTLFNNYVLINENNQVIRWHFSSVHCQHWSPLVLTCVFYLQVLNKYKFWNTSVLPFKRCSLLICSLYQHVTLEVMFMLEFVFSFFFELEIYLSLNTLIFNCCTSLYLFQAKDIMSNYQTGVLQNSAKMVLLFHLIDESVRRRDKILVFR